MAGGTPTRVRMCLRLAILPEQGNGWSEYTGEKWVEPRLNGGACLVIDDNRCRRTVIDDVRDSKLYETATYDPSDRVKPSFKDKQWNETGFSIQCRKYFKELTAGSIRQNEMVEHVESHVFVDPMNPMNRGNSAYNTGGMQAGQTFSLFRYTNGNLRSMGGTVSNIPEFGDIVFAGNKAEARRTMLVLQASESEFIVKGISHSLLLKPRPSGTELNSGTSVYDDKVNSGALSRITCNNPTMDVIVSRTIVGVEVASTLLGSGTGIRNSFSNPLKEVYNKPANAGFMSVIVSSGAELVVKDVDGNIYPSTSFVTKVLMLDTWNLVAIGGPILNNGIGSVSFRGVLADLRIASCTAQDSVYLVDNVQILADDITQNEGRAFIPR